MGGWGSGVSRGYSTTDGRLRLSIRDLRKTGNLVAGKFWLWQWSRGSDQSGSIQGSTETEKIVLSYCQRTDSGEWQDISFPVWLDWTDCNYGGKRAWFRCPFCGQRVGVLYNGGSRFACRKCLRLNYKCQREGEKDRAFRRAHKLRVKLGCRDSYTSKWRIKPKGMRWATYERLCEEENYYGNRGCQIAMTALMKCTLA